MNSCSRNPLRTMISIGSLLISGVIVSACGGGGGSSQSAGIGGTGISVSNGTVQGKVTGFGSVYVDDDEFNTDKSNFLVDGDEDADQGDLAIGMIVTLKVETRKGVHTGKAFDVIYDDEVQGPVAVTPVDIGGGQKTFNVFGQTVTIDEIETVFEGTSFDTLDADDVVEISGYRSSGTEIIASYVELTATVPDGSEVELRGTVDGYVPPTQEFMLDGFLITFDDDTDIEVNGGLADGAYVEVEGTYQEAVPSVHADEIEEEDEGLGDDVDEVSLQGPISDYIGIESFKINGQQVDASQASLSPANAEALLDNGIEVEVEGDIVAGVLMADELQIEEVETSLKAFVSFVFGDNIRFEVEFTGLAGSVEIVTNAETEFEDDSPLELPNFSVADMNVGDFVVVEGVESSGKVIAGAVKRKDSADPDDSELEGQVDSFVVDTSITVLGIAFGVDGSTQYEDSSESVSSVVFFGNLGIGDQVEIVDEVTADGIAEEVELDD